MEEMELKYVGFDIMQNPDGVILDQGQYLQKLESIVIKPDRAKRKNLHMQKNYLCFENL